MVAKETFLAWLQNPVTKQMMEMLREDRKFYLECLSSDNYLLEDGYPRLAAKWSAAVHVINNILNVRYIDIEEGAAKNE